jgi:hypothetical protein
MKRFSILAFAFALALITVGCGGGQVGSFDSTTNERA